MVRDEIIAKAVDRYQCLQNGDFRIERTPTYIALCWNATMDNYINMVRVYQVARFLRKYTNLPIYCSTHRIDI